MTKAQQSRNIADSIARLRKVLDDIEDSQAAGDDLLTMQLAERIEEHSAAISWSAAANAHQVPGTSWTVIGGRLGITRQAAQQRFGATG